MNSIMMITIVSLLTFSYWIVNQVVTCITKIFGMTQINKFVIYIWGASVIIAAIFIKPNIVFNLPMVNSRIIFVSLAILIINLIVARYSGYEPVGKYNLINFVIFYPVFEEVVFRGVILPLLDLKFSFELIEIAYLPVTIAVILSAFLFSIAHLQYYKLNKQSIHFMFFAFIGGILFGAIANETKSIVIPLVLHIGFNGLAAYYSFANNKDK